MEVMNKDAVWSSDSPAEHILSPGRPFKEFHICARNLKSLLTDTEKFKIINEEHSITIYT